MRVQKFKKYDIGYQEFIMLPKFLIFDEKFKDLGFESKLLYSIMLNRMNYSVKNDWIDNKGNIFLIYTIQEIMEMFQVSNKKAIQMLKNLEMFKLIEKKVQGNGKPNLIYLNKLNYNLNSKNIINEKIEKILNSN